MTAIPPLFGDASGNYRIHIVGNSGAGKSTLGKQLSEILRIPYISLDELFWKPGWGKSSREEFQAKIRTRLSENSSWIVDGNYTKRVRGVVRDAATDVIWLDPPFVLYFGRLLVRTFSRLLGVAPPCSPGCEETTRAVFFSSDSIIWWCITNHRVLQAMEQLNLLQSGIQVGGKMRRIGGWGSDLKNWVAAVQEQEQVRLQLRRVE